MPDVRQSAVAGTFYPSDPGDLRSLLADFVGSGVRSDATGAIVPHAGLVYSGACAGEVFSSITVPDTCVIVAPNHTGHGVHSAAGTWSRGSFRTPLGDVDIAADLVDAVCNKTSLVAEDREAHRFEHAVEVVLLFAQHLVADVKLMPIVLPWVEWSFCRELAQVLAEVITDLGRDVLLVASSDMNHYEAADVALVKDTAALEAITKMDGEGLLEICNERNVTMCGRGPAAVVLECCKQLGATSATVVDYRHSGMITGDTDSVVSYAGVVIA